MSSQSSRQQRLAHIPPGARPGEGLLQWNLGGWLGTLLGSSLWLALAAAILTPFKLVLGLGVFGCFLAINGIGFLLWRRKDRIAPHLALQLLCLASFCAAAASFAMISSAGLGAAISEELGNFHSLGLWPYLSVYPILMLGLAWLDRCGRAAGGESR